MPAAPPRARKGPPAEGSSPGGPATFMAARRGWSSDGGLSPAKHGRVPAFGTPPRRQRRRSSLLYGGAAEDRPKNLRRALRPRHAHFRSRAAPTWPIPTWACADGCEHGHGRPEAALQPRGPASPGLPPHADGTSRMRQASPPVLASAASRSTQQSGYRTTAVRSGDSAAPTSPLTGPGALPRRGSSHLGVPLVRRQRGSEPGWD